MSFVSSRLSHLEILQALTEQARSQQQLYLPVAVRPQLSLTLLVPFLLPLALLFAMPASWSAALRQTVFVVVALACMGLLLYLLWRLLVQPMLMEPGRRPGKGWSGWQVDVGQARLTQIGAKAGHQLSLRPAGEWRLQTTRLDGERPALGLELHHASRGPVALLTRFVVTEDATGMMAAMDALAKQLAQRLGLAYVSGLEH